MNHSSYKLLPIQELSLLCFGRRYFLSFFFPVKNKMTIKEIYAILISLTLSSDLLPFLLPLNQNSHYFITQIQILHRKLASLVDVTLFFKMWLHKNTREWKPQDFANCFKIAPKHSSAKKRHPINKIKIR